MSVQKKWDTIHYQPYDFEEFFKENDIVEIYENSEALKINLMKKI